MAAPDLPARWTRLWKIYGSLGWKANDRGDIVRTGGCEASQLVFPAHLKYDQTLEGALFGDVGPPAIVPCDSGHFAHFERLLLCRRAYFSAIEEGLAGNSSASLFAFQYQKLDKETCAIELASRRPNFSVYARDGAVVSGITAPWRAPPEYPTRDRAPIRSSYWTGVGGGEPEFQLGSIDWLARFFAASRAPLVSAPPASATP